MPIWPCFRPLWTYWVLLYGFRAWIKPLVITYKFDHTIFVRSTISSWLQIYRHQSQAMQYSLTSPFFGREPTILQRQEKRVSRFISLLNCRNSFEVNKTVIGAPSVGSRGAAWESPWCAIEILLCIARLCFALLLLPLLKYISILHFIFINSFLIQICCDRQNK